MSERAPSRPRPLANHRWIRGRIGDTTVIDTIDALLVWEHPYYPHWYIPIDDVAGEVRPTGATTPTDDRGPAHAIDLVLADGTVVEAAGHHHPDAPDPELHDRVRFRWDAIDRWSEEEVEVFVHPRSPYTRVDVLPSTRHVVVEIDGITVADTRRASILYETGLPARYYLPPEDVRTELLVPTSTSTACPYKGVARYWSVVTGQDGDQRTHRDIAWGYDDPLPESALVQGLICFYNEKVDLTVDGRHLPRPVTKFS